jgi:hypothetical protein
MTLASPSYSQDSATVPPTIPHPECEPYKQVIRTLVDTVHAKDDAIAKLQVQTTHKDAEVEKVTKVAESQGGSTDIGTVALSVAFGALLGLGAAKMLK